MIPSLIAFLVHLTVVYVFAQAEAWSDHMLIKNGYSIDHVRAWFIRAGVIALSIVILVPFFGPFEGNDLMGFNLWTVTGVLLDVGLWVLGCIPVSTEQREGVVAVVRLAIQPLRLVLHPLDARRHRRATKGCYRMALGTVYSPRCLQGRHQ
jgi:hypothetical protein